MNRWIFWLLVSGGAIAAYLIIPNQPCEPITIGTIGTVLNVGGCSR